MSGQLGNIGKVEVKTNPPNIHFGEISWFTKIYRPLLHPFNHLEGSIEAQVT